MNQKTTRKLILAGAAALGSTGLLALATFLLVHWGTTSAIEQGLDADALYLVLSFLPAAVVLVVLVHQNAGHFLARGFQWLMKHLPSWRFFVAAAAGTVMAVTTLSYLHRGEEDQDQSEDVLADLIGVPIRPRQVPDNGDLEPESEYAEAPILDSSSPAIAGVELQINTGETFPLEPQAPGRVIVIVPAGSPRAFRRTVEAQLSEVPGVDVFTPDVTSHAFRHLWLFRYRPPYEDNRTPWGTQYFLLTTWSLENLPDVKRPLHSVAVTLSWRLIRADDGVTLLKGTDSHTGIGASREQALAQAVERCLFEVTEFLEAEGKA